MYLLVLSESLKTSLCSRTTVFPGFAGTFSFGARLTPLNLASLEKRKRQRFNEFCHSPFLLFIDRFFFCIFPKDFQEVPRGGREDLALFPDDVHAVGKGG